MFRNRPTRAALALVVLLLAAAAPRAEDESPLDGLRWLSGPCTGDLDDVAEVRVPAGYVFLGGDDTRTLMEAMENPVNGDEVGLLGPDGLDWFVCFDFENVGYVRDDEKGSLDADEMMRSIRAGNKESNKLRRRRGWPEFRILGWVQPPRYNEWSHNLEWAIRGETDEGEVVNWNTRLLGRRGVMRVTLVSDPEDLDAVLPLFEDRMKDYSFSGGNRYAEFVKGDRVAEIGLSALVVGGAAAVAVKSGLFKYVWKLLVVGAIAVGSFFKRLTGRK